MTDHFKAYYITCHLLSQFEGLHTMLAEEELFNLVHVFVEKPWEKNKTNLIKELEFVFGLEEENLTKALADYESYRKEEL